MFGTLIRLYMCGFQLRVISLFLRRVPDLWSLAETQPVCPVTISVSLRKLKSSALFDLVLEYNSWLQEICLFKLYGQL